MINGLLTTDQSCRAAAYKDGVRVARHPGPIAKHCAAYRVLFPGANRLRPAFIRSKPLACCPKKGRLIHVSGDKSSHWDDTVARVFSTPN